MTPTEALAKLREIHDWMTEYRSELAAELGIEKREWAIYKVHQAQGCIGDAIPFLKNHIALVEHNPCK